MITIAQAKWIRERSKHWQRADRKLPSVMACWIALHELKEIGEVTLSEEEQSDWIAFAWRVDHGNSDINQQLPHTVVERYLTTLSSMDRALIQAKGIDELTLNACFWWYLQQSIEQAGRLALPQTGTVGAHDPYVVIGQVEGFEAGAELAEQFGFSEHLCDTLPDTFWHCLDSRQEGDALIAFYGDDRGWTPTYTTVVTWAPQVLMACYERPLVLS